MGSDHRALRATGRARTLFLGIVCLGAGALLLLAPGESLRGARNGLSLCADVVIPSLFPFMCLSGLVIRSGLAEKAGRFLAPVTRFLFRLPGCAALALGLGIIGGYPVGASAAAELRKAGAIDQRQGNRLLCVSINSSPAFIVGAVGAGILHSAGAGLLLYAAHIGASLLLGVSLGFADRLRPGGAEKNRRPGGKYEPPAQAFVYSVAQAAGSMVSICGFVVLFAAFISLFQSIGMTDALAALLCRLFPCADAAFFRSLLIGMLEVTNGCAEAGKSGPLLLMPVLLSFSGFSVICQAMSATAKTDLSVRLFVATRPLHIFFSLALTLLLLHFFPSAVPAMASASAPVAAAVHSAPSCAALLVFSALLLLSLLRV